MSCGCFKLTQIMNFATIFYPLILVVTSQGVLGQSVIVANAVSTPSPLLLTTPDDKSWNVSHPSDVATNCINAMGQSIEDFCTNLANADWDPSKLNTSSVTDLENCCSLFDVRFVKFC